MKSFFLPYGSWRSKLSSLSLAAGDFPCRVILLSQWYYLITQVPKEKPTCGHTEPTHLLKKWFGGRLNYFFLGKFLPGGGTWLARHPENQAQNRGQRIIMLISVWHWLFKCHEQGLLQCWMRWKSHLNSDGGKSPAVINLSVPGHVIKWECQIWCASYTWEKHLCCLGLSTPMKQNKVRQSKHNIQDQGIGQC